MSPSLSMALSHIPIVKTSAIFCWTPSSSSGPIRAIVPAQRRLHCYEGKGVFCILSQPVPRWSFSHRQAFLSPRLLQPSVHDFKKKAVYMVWCLEEKCSLYKCGLRSLDARLTLTCETQGGQRRLLASENGSTWAH